MVRLRLADRVAHHMLRAEYGQWIMWGDGALGDAVYGHVTGKLANHPLDRMIAACNALDRAPDLFEKHKSLGMDHNGRNKWVRSYRLIGTPRPLPEDQKNG